MWLAESYPLSLQDQIMPIIDLMVRVCVCVCARACVTMQSTTPALSFSVCLSVSLSLFLQSLNNAHFAKLKDFIALQMPAGFPVKFGE